MIAGRRIAMWVLRSASSVISARSPPAQWHVERVALPGIPKAGRQSRRAERHRGVSPGCCSRVLQSSIEKALVMFCSDHLAGRIEPTRCD